MRACGKQPGKTTNENRNSGAVNRIAELFICSAHHGGEGQDKLEARPGPRARC